MLCVVLKCKSTNKKFQIQGQEQVEKNLNTKNAMFFAKHAKEFDLIHNKIRS